MKTKEENKSYASIHFHGQFRPIHSESDSVENAVTQLLVKLKCEKMKSKLKEIHRDFKQSRKAGIGIVSVSSSHGSISVSLADYPRDNWLDSLTIEFPNHPLIQY